MESNVIQCCHLTEGEDITLDKASSRPAKFWIRPAKHERFYQVQVVCMEIFELGHTFVN